MDSQAGPSDTSRKRKAPPATDCNTTKSSRGASISKGKAKGKRKEDVIWPEYFDSLFKVFKALNTVLAFCSSRKHMATTFTVVRSSVESLLKQPLDLSKVAEIKALLPDIVKFAYIPRNELRVHGDSRVQSEDRGGRRDRSPDYGAFMESAPSSSRIGGPTEDEHVLILEFVDNAKGKKSANAGFALAPPPSLTPQAVQKLIEKRNLRFSQAVNELLHATSDSNDPVALLQSAAHDHIPVNPSTPSRASPFSDVKGKVAVPESKDRATIEAIINEIQTQGWYKGQIVDHRVFDAKASLMGTLDTPLSPRISQALKESRNITALYGHQVAAINAVSSGDNVIVSTSTASGKSVIYQLPVLKFLEEDADATAIFIYPTKALAQDQKAALEQLLCACPSLEHIKVATYDGDTPQDKRAVIRETTSVIFTNFDMLHASILPHEDLWRRFLKNLKIVAVDELHYYSDLFGSHVAMVMRRFRRVCAAVGNRRSRFVSCSATIAKPKQHMKDIFGIEDVVEIMEDGAPSGRKDFLVWNPPPLDAMDPTLGRHSSMSEAVGLMRFLMKRGVRCILFCKIRKTCELAMKTLRSDLSAEGRLDILNKVMSYRGGYSQEDRRRIEREAFSGQLLGIVATNALELGVDIGVLDAVIMLGFPVSVASFRQQAGRAGRRARDALAVFVADSLPIDQHYIEYPNELFDTPVKDLVIDLESKIILEAHLQCAAHEMPLTLEDEKYFGPLTKELCETKLSKDKDGWYHPHPKFLPYPARHIALRGVEEEKYVVIDVTKLGQAGGDGHIVEEVEVSRALFEIYEGAVFIHQGMTFVVKEVSHDSKQARVIRADVNFITQPRDFTNVDATQTHRIREIKASLCHAFYGRIELLTLVFGYFKIRNKKILDSVDLETPPWRRETTGFWIDVPKETLHLLKEKSINAAAAIHSAQHAILNRFAMRGDLHTECKVPEKEYRTTESQRKRPARLIFYDTAGKGGGVAGKAFDHVSEILTKAHERVAMCSCEEGCAECVNSPSCREGNVVSSKLGAFVVLKSLLGLPIDPDSIPEQYEEPLQGYQTIIEAPPVRAIVGVDVEKE
ncbi:hypothetical protein JAAARDRAFT_555490 [Jaapia argillacea MUCL 33604]|uniref:Uncharacterized protein n=1 Tax=Jaapia argillacea MUCL 33604 TaxID=933084 RepID=A0A067QAS7_9AGAM|nr:hypothetical protein JAAARDRAFT_555490 [Jaapia argillacea MUCL 33604]